ncbi:DUF300-domain-containing protein [Clavulina sp. PMI_390]|nr:DUF300-domain-containing protein [Clavulina sp. PMI_390]
MPSPKATCPVETVTATSPPLIQNGKITIQGISTCNQVGWLLCGICALIATSASFWLINKHLQFYTNVIIIRLLFLVPIYSLVTLAAYIDYSEASPYLILQTAYESFVVYAFFYLMLQYLSPNDIERRNIIRRKPCFEPQNHWKWMFPLGRLKYRPKNGLYFLQLMKWGILQYCVIRPLGSIISVILEAANLYCEASWSPIWAHVWIVTIVSISVTIAMYCLLQLYLVISKDIAVHRPLLQFISVKAVVFLTFWQSGILSALAMINVVKDVRTSTEIIVGISAVLQNFEMVIIAFVHLKAFSYLPYRPKPLPALPPGPGDAPSKEAYIRPQYERTPRLAALRHAFSFGETWRELREGAIYLWNTMRGREAEPHSRLHHFEAVMGVERPIIGGNGGVKSQPFSRQVIPQHWDDRRSPPPTQLNRHQRRVSVSYIDPLVWSSLAELFLSSGILP